LIFDGINGIFFGRGKTEDLATKDHKEHKGGRFFAEDFRGLKREMQVMVSLGEEGKIGASWDFARSRGIPKWSLGTRGRRSPCRLALGGGRIRMGGYAMDPVFPGGFDERGGF
jgi:hypothetical protein